MNHQRRYRTLPGGCGNAALCEETSVHPHLHETETGLRQRIQAAGIYVAAVAETDSQDRGPGIGHVPGYTVTLCRREDERTHTFKVFDPCLDPDRPDVFDLMDTLTIGSDFIEHRWLDDDTINLNEDDYRQWASEWAIDPAEYPSEETFHAQVDEKRLLRAFVEGPDCWTDWVHYTDRDPGRQDDYGNTENDDVETGCE